MRQLALIYLIDEDPIQGELEDLPEPSALYVTVHSPRRRDGRPVGFLEGTPETILLAWHRISHIQLLPQGDLDNIIGFVRE